VLGQAAGGKDAVTLLASLDEKGRRADVLVMDLEVAPVGGIDAIRRIRALYDGVEVIALASFAEEERVNAALEAGASGLLPRDAHAEEVATAVRAAHRGELHLHPAIAKRFMAALREAPAGGPVAGLTARELEVLRLVGVGKPNKEIAAELAISERTARTHVSRIIRKLELSSRTQAALWAVRKGLVDTERDLP